MVMDIGERFLPKGPQLQQTLMAIQFGWIPRDSHSEAEKNGKSEPRACPGAVAAIYPSS